MLLPLIVLMGFAMSPWLDAMLAGWVDIVGGRQSARSIHFIVAWLLVAFVAIHVFQVIVTGLWNNLRSMITGRYRVPPEARHDQRPFRLQQAPAAPHVPRARCGGGRRRWRSPAATACRAPSGFPKVLGSVEPLNDALAKLIGRNAMAQEFAESDRSPTFRSNGTDDPGHADSTTRGVANGFADYALNVGGLVRSAAQVLARRAARAAVAHADHAARLRRGLERDRQVEGRARSSALLDVVRPKPEARYVVFYCADPMSMDGTISITRASTWTTPATRRRSSPTT